MTPSNSNILVRFHEEIETPSNLIIPERYTVHEKAYDGDNETRTAVTTDRRLINPQIVDVLSGEYEGETAFVYYGAYETAVWPDDRAIIQERNLLFLLNPIRPLPGIQLGEEVFVEGDRTESGIYRSTNTGGVDGIKVKILYGTMAGKTIVTQDSAQYWLLYGGKKYLMVRDKFIAAYYEGEKLTPTGTNVIAELAPLDTSIEKHNEGIRAHLDFLNRHGMHYDPKQFVMKEQPKIVEAMVNGQKWLVQRSGVKVDGVWVLEKDALLGELISSEKTQG